MRLMAQVWAPVSNSAYVVQLPFPANIVTATIGLNVVVSTPYAPIFHSLSSSCKQVWWAFPHLSHRMLSLSQSAERCPRSKQRKQRPPLPSIASFPATSASRKALQSLISWNDVPPQFLHLKVSLPTAPLFVCPCFSTSVVGFFPFPFFLLPFASVPSV